MKIREYLSDPIIKNSIIDFIDPLKSVGLYNEGESYSKKVKFILDDTARLFEYINFLYSLEDKKEFINIYYQTFFSFLSILSNLPDGMFSYETMKNCNIKEYITNNDDYFRIGSESIDFFDGVGILLDHGYFPVSENIEIVGFAGYKGIDKDSTSVKVFSKKRGFYVMNRDGSIVKEKLPSGEDSQKNFRQLPVSEVQDTSSNILPFKPKN